jgi:hypothetical protein
MLACLFGLAALVSGFTASRKLPFWPMFLLGGTIGFALGIGIQIASA